MIKLDLKDRKILYELDLNCRQSNAQIGKKVGLSREIVSYRIKRMEDEGIISCYWTAINTFKLGYYVFRIYINLIDVSTKIKTEIIQYFMKNEDAWAVITSKGPVDLDVVLWVKDVYAFNQYWTNTLQQYGKYFTKSTISILNDTISCKKTYLLDAEKSSSGRELYTTSCKGDPVPIDEIDYQILNELALKARTPLLDLAQKLHCSAQTINYRIQRLIEKEIIQAFRISINPKKLGLQGCAVDLYLKDQTMRNQILEHIKQKPIIYDIMTMSIGWADLCFQVYITSINELSKLMEELEMQFPDTIRRYEYWMDLTVHKERWLPKMTKKDFIQKKGEEITE
jgi:Lrp/AsnC family transcriptional regulator, leucine-responsive regulatory protein